MKTEMFKQTNCACIS